MKRNIFALTIVMAALFVFNSCGKYEEGPGVSLLSKKARITGVWSFDKMFVDGTEVVLDEMMKAAKVELIKDGTGKMSMSFMGFTFNSDLEWEFNDEKTHLKMRMKDFETSEWDEWDESEILRLTNKECWLKNVDTYEDVTTTTITHLAKE
jgi:hypothetical protein